MAALIKVKYITSRRGTPQVFVNGYLYNRNKVRQTCVHWRCSIKTCTGKCTTIDDFVRNTSEHNHPPESEELLTFVSTLRKRAREETTHMHSLYNDEITRQDEALIPQFPSFPSMSSALYRHRKKNLPSLPKSRAEVNLEGSWTEASDGRPFLLINDGEDNKILAFSTTEQLEILQSADVLYMDGTFSSCPELWDQVYVIHARCQEVMYPLVYVLLPDRQLTTYARLFSLLKTEVQQRLNRPLAPTKVQTDFELAAIRAIEREFPEAEVKGCFFHYAQAIWRKTQDLGLAALYKDNPDVKRWIRRAAGLPLLPLHEVQDAWLEAMDESPDVNRAEEFNDYVVVNWVDYGARFPLRLWNHHETDGPRTNNHLEGFHNRLNRTLPHSHPNIFRFIEVIKKIECSEKAKVAQLNFGAAPPKKKRVYKEIEHRVIRLKSQLTEGTKTTLQFLDAIGHLLKLA